MRQVKIILIAAAILFAGVLIRNLFIGMKESPEKKDGIATTRVVKALNVKLDTILKPIPVSGILQAGERIEVYSEVNGTLMNTGKPFKVGQHYNQGEVMLSMDGSESLLSLKSQRSAFINTISQVLPDIKIDYEQQYTAWKSFLDKLNPDQNLPELPEVDVKLKNFLSGRNIYQQYYAVKSLENRQSKYTIEAPFSGTVSVGSANQGTLIRTGQKIGEFVQDGAFEFEAAIPATDAFNIQRGDKVTLKVPNTNLSIVGEIIRTASVIDQSTQQMSIFARVQDERLKQGMFLEGLINSMKIEGVMKINRNLIAENHHVFLIENGILVKTPITVAHRFEQEAFIIGLKTGDILLNQVIEGAFEGMKVTPEIQ